MKDQWVDSPLPSPSFRTICSSQKKGGNPVESAKNGGCDKKCPADSLFPQDLNADFDKALASPSQATREVSPCILAVECLQVGTVFHVVVCFLWPWAPVSWIATRLDLRLLRLSKWAWAYTWYTDASNRAGNSLCENWKHQWIFGESKLKPSICTYFFIWFV